MSDFKGFLGAVRRGDMRDDLFIYSTAIQTKANMHRLMDEAHEAGLSPHLAQSKNILIIGVSRAYFRTAHDHLHRELLGMRFTALHNLDALDGLHNAREVGMALAAQVR